MFKLNSVLVFRNSNKYYYLPVYFLFSLFLFSTKAFPIRKSRLGRYFLSLSSHPLLNLFFFSRFYSCEKSNLCCRFGLIWAYRQRLHLFYPIVSLKFRYPAPPTILLSKYGKDVFLLRNPLSRQLFKCLNPYKRNVIYRTTARLTILWRQLFRKDFFSSFLSRLIVLYPLVSFRRIRYGRIVYFVPREGTPERRDTEAIKMFVAAVKSHRHFRFFNKLTVESVNVFLGQEAAFFKLLERYYADIVSNRLYVHFRW